MNPAWRRLFVLGLLTLACRSTLAAQPAAAGKFELRDGDRVVLLGNTLIEREQTHGYLETALLSRWPGRKIIFRNLGWSGDTVWGEARAGFGTAADGFRHLKQHVESLQPTVIIVHYGSNESFEGPAGLNRFVEGFNHLLDILAATKARIVLLSPLAHEDLGRPLPDPSQHNADLKLYTEAIAMLAQQRGYDFVNLFESLRSSEPLTDNGIHLTDYGYWRMAPVVEEALGLPAPDWRVELDASQSTCKTVGTRLSNIKSNAQEVSFETLDERLPYPASPREKAALTDGARSAARLLVARGLADGRYTLKIDGQPIGTLQAKGGELKAALLTGPEFEQVETLRDKILLKNELYFHRWRPQNETYLFGFRKHEQGQNAVEIPQFDPLVAAEEAAIQKLSLPVHHVYQLIKMDES